MTPTNPDCINSDKVNYGCVALTKIEYGCLKGICPFFKSREAFEKDEKWEKQRCISLGFHFRTRKEVIDDMNKVTEEQKKRYYKNLKKKNLTVPRIIQYNSATNEFIEYESMSDAVKKLGITYTQLELLVSRGEEWHGYRFAKA